MVHTTSDSTSKTNPTQNCFRLHSSAVHCALHSHSPSNIIELIRQVRVTAQSYSIRPLWEQQLLPLNHTGTAAGVEGTSRERDVYPLPRGKGTVLTMDLLKSVLNILCLRVSMEDRTQQWRLLLVSPLLHPSPAQFHSPHPEKAHCQRQ